MTADGVRREAAAQFKNQQVTTPASPMGLHGGECTIRRELEEKRRERRWERRLRPLWLCFWIVVVFVVHALSCCCCRTTIAWLKLGESWPASGSSEDQKEGGVPPPFPASPPLSLIDVRRQPIQKLELNLKHADACMQAHRSPSDGGKLDEGRLVRR